MDKDKYNALMAIMEKKLLLDEHTAALDPKTSKVLTITNDLVTKEKLPLL